MQVAVIAFTPFIVQADHSNTLHHVYEAVLEAMCCRGNRLRHQPNLNLANCPVLKLLFFRLNQRRLHILIIL